VQELVDQRAKSYTIPALAPGLFELPSLDFRA
jgi:hypothetical protein